jgi:hypothetical protein
MGRNRTYTFDKLLQLKDAGLVAASAAAQVASADKIIDIGGSSANTDQGGGSTNVGGTSSPGYFEGDIVVDITAIEVDTGNEKFTILAQVSNSATFADTIFNVGAIVVGDSSTALESVDSVAGRRILKFCNQVNDVTYRYLRLYTQVVGTIATGINYSAFVGVQDV